jgi:hypothetical protein
MEHPSFVDCTCFFLPKAQKHLLGFLNSKCFWFQLVGMTPVARGGYFRLKSQYFYQITPCETSGLADLVETASSAAVKLVILIKKTLHRLADLSKEIEAIASFRNWPNLTFSELVMLLRKRCKVIIPVSERDEWERWFITRKAEAAAFAGQIADAQAEIDRRVYRSFGLTRNEIAAIEDALRVASPSLNLDSYEAISAVEGLELSQGARGRLAEHDRRRGLAA